MGVVALARHLDLQTWVALKLLDGGQSSPHASQRLLREGRAAAKLQGEHVARVLDTGVEGDAPFLVMEFVPGQNLAQVLAERGPFPQQEAVDLTLQACEAIAEAHALGIIHRDIKPSNLIRSERTDGTPRLKVLDFGISKNLIEQGASLTGSAVLLGSPKYVAPEQVRDARAASPASDVWSLGVTLYELLTGQAPFDGPVIPGILAQIVADTPRAPRELRPELPAGLEGVLLRCLSKVPEERPRDAAELASLLAPFGTESGEISARRAALTAERLRHLREHPEPTEAPPGLPGLLADPGATAPEPWPPDAGSTAEQGATFAPIDPTPSHTRSGAHQRLSLLVFASLGVLGVGSALLALSTRALPAAPSQSDPAASASQASASQASASQASAPQASAPQASAPQASAPQASASAALPPRPSDWGAEFAPAMAPPSASSPPEVRVRARPPRAPRAAPAAGDDLGPRL